MNQSFRGGGYQHLTLVGVRGRLSYDPVWPRGVKDRWSHRKKQKGDYWTVSGHTDTNIRVEEFPPCLPTSSISWLLYVHQGQISPSSYCMCVSIGFFCCIFDAAINLPSPPFLPHMSTLTQGWLDFGGKNSWSRSLQPHVPRTCNLVDWVYMIYPESFWLNVAQIDSLTRGWRISHWKQQPDCKRNRGDEWIDTVGQIPDLH